MAVDSLHYETAYKAFSAGNFPEAGKAFARYLEKYPSGLFTPDAAYYMAESALKAGDTLEAKKGTKNFFPCLKANTRKARW